MNAVYTALDDLPCESHKQDYIWKIPFTPESQFTTALIFFNQEVVFAWYNGRVYVDRIPNDFVINFETELGAKYRKFEYEHEPEPEHYEVPVDHLQATIDLQSPYSNLSKQAYWEIHAEIRFQFIDELKQRAFDKAMAEPLNEEDYEDDDFYPSKPSRFRTEAEERHIDELKQEAFERAMAEC